MDGSVLHVCPLCERPLDERRAFRVDLSKNYLLFDGKAVKMARREAEILSVVIAEGAKGRWPSGVEIFSKVWPDGEIESEHIVAVLASRINKKLRPLGAEMVGLMGRGVSGYKLHRLEDGHGRKASR